MTTDRRRVLVRFGRWQFDYWRRCSLGDRLVTLTHHDHSWEFHQGRLTRREHLPIASRR